MSSAMSVRRGVVSKSSWVMFRCAARTKRLEFGALMRPPRYGTMRLAVASSVDFCHIRMARTL